MNRKKNLWKTKKFIFNGSKKMKVFIVQHSFTPAKSIKSRSWQGEWEIKLSTPFRDISATP